MPTYYWLKSINLMEDRFKLLIITQPELQLMLRVAWQVLLQV